MSNCTACLLPLIIGSIGLAGFGLFFGGCCLWHKNIRRELITISTSCTVGSIFLAVIYIWMRGAP